jgi:hypothetical protein
MAVLQWRADGRHTAVYTMSGAPTLAGMCPAPFLLIHPYCIISLRLQGLGVHCLGNAGFDHVERLAELLLGHV